MSATAGSLLKEAREARGLTLEEAAAATRVRAPYLEALEDDQPQKLPAPVYARGYLRTYAQLLELEPEPLLASIRPAGPHPERTVKPVDTRLFPKPPALTPGLAVAGLLAALIGGLGLYAHHELSLVAAPAPRAAPVLIAHQAQPSPSPHPSAAPSLAPAAAVAPARHPAAAPGLRPGAEVSVELRFSADVWVYVVVDGKPFYGADGTFFSAGQSVSFTGRDVSVTTGKGAATDVLVDGEDQGFMPDGVTTRDYTPQT